MCIPKMWNLLFNKLAASDPCITSASLVMTSESIVSCSRNTSWGMGESDIDGRSYQTYQSLQIAMIIYMCCNVWYEMFFSQFFSFNTSIVPSKKDYAASLYKAERILFVLRESKQDPDRKNVTKWSPISLTWRFVPCRKLSFLFAITIFLSFRTECSLS